MSAARWARRFIRLYPRGFRDAHGADMEATLTRLVQIEWDRLGFLAPVAVAFGAMADASKVRLRHSNSTTSEEPPERRFSGGGTWIGDLVQDFRYAVRGMIRRPLFFCAAVVTLGLGIGASTAAFSLINGLAIRPLPYPDAGELIVVWSTNAERGWTRTDVTLGDVWDWRERTDGLEDLGAIGRVTHTLTGDGVPVVVSGARITPNVFGILGASPKLGRFPIEADAVPEAPAIVVLSHALWESRYGSDPDVVGTSVVLDDVSYTVIGVAEPGLTYMDMGHVDFWSTLRVDLSTASHSNHSYRAIGRLRDGVSVEQARAELSAVAASLAQELPESNDGWGVQVLSAGADILGDVGRPLSIVLSIGMAFLLLMACTNVANLLLARGNLRSRELAVRAAIGAGRGRVVRLLLTESLLIGAVGAFVGLGFAVLGNRWVASAIPPQAPTTLDLSIDRNVVMFLIVATLFAVFLFGMIPAFRASRNLSERMRSAEASWSGRRAGTTLVVVQMALATVLMIGGGLMVRTALNIQSVPLGFDAEGVTTFRISPPSARYAGGEELRGFYRELRTSLAALPEVESVGNIANIPLGGSNSVGTARWWGDGEDDEFPVRYEYVSPGYFETMRVSIVEGRTVLESDGPEETAPLVAWVNEALLERHFEGADPIGATMNLGPDEPFLIVGVIADVHERALNRTPEPAVYISTRQQTLRNRHVVVRTAGGIPITAERLGQVVAEIDPSQGVQQVQPLTAVVEARQAGFTLMSGLIGGFALIALLLGSVGIYGVTVYSVSQRTREIGLRMALGSAAGGVRSLILREGAFRASIGAVIGLIGAFALTSVLEALLVGVSPTDPTTFAAVILILGSVVMLGSYLPARRASKVDPVNALAQD